MMIPVEELLLKNGRITEGQLGRAKALELKRPGRRLSELLVELGYVRRRRFYPVWQRMEACGLWIWISIRLIRRRPGGFRAYLPSGTGCFPSDFRRDVF